MIGRHPVLPPCRHSMLLTRLEVGHVAWCLDLVSVVWTVCVRGTLVHVSLQYPSGHPAVNACVKWRWWEGVTRKGTGYPCPRCCGSGLYLSYKVFLVASSKHRAQFTCLSSSKLLSLTKIYTGFVYSLIIITLGTYSILLSQKSCTWGD